MVRQSIISVSSRLRLNCLAGFFKAKMFPHFLRLSLLSLVEGHDDDTYRMQSKNVYIQFSFIRPFNLKHKRNFLNQQKIYLSERQKCTIQTSIHFTLCMLERWDFLSRLLFQVEIFIVLMDIENFLQNFKSVYCKE